jgi:hypothetical protein
VPGEPSVGVVWMGHPRNCAHEWRLIEEHERSIYSEAETLIQGPGGSLVRRYYCVFCRTVVEDVVGGRGGGER